MKTSTNFQLVETRLNNALTKVKQRLEVLSERSGLPIDEQMKHPDHAIWNDLHDLEYRLNDRLWDNWSAAKSAHWDKHGFNVY